MRHTVRTQAKKWIREREEEQREEAGAPPRIKSLEEIQDEGARQAKAFAEMAAIVDGTGATGG